MRKSQNKGLFITIEKTVEGIGGTTLAQGLYEKLVGAGIETVLTKEPGGTLVGQKLREIFLDPTAGLSRATTLFIMMADRSQNYKENLKPALKSGKVVISDRFLDSTLSIQGSAEGWKTAFLLRLHQATTGMLLPDVTVVLNGVPHKPLGEDRIESQGAEFHQRVKEGMLHFATKAERYLIVNANRPPEDVLEEVWETLRTRFPERFELSS